MDDEIVLVFTQNETEFKKIDKSVEPDWLLKQKGLFYFKDVIKVLSIRGSDLRRMAMKLGETRAWREMGMRKCWTRWVCKMEVFAPYLENTNAREFMHVKRVKPEWDGNELLNQEGVFFLTEVTKKLPVNWRVFSNMWHRTRRKKDERTAYLETGIYRVDNTTTYLVDIAIFRELIKKAWPTKPDHRH